MQDLNCHPEFISGSINVIPQGEKSSLIRLCRAKQLSIVLREVDLGGYQLFSDSKVKTHPLPLPNHGGEKKAAFTLAEVLITLAIIGVVAAMTIPTLISNYQEKIRVTQLLKVHSQLSNAWQMIQLENGNIDTWGLSKTNTGEVDEDGDMIYDKTAGDFISDLLQKQFRVTKTCQKGEACEMRDRYTMTGELKTQGGFILTDKNETSENAYFCISDGTCFMVGNYSKDQGGHVSVRLPDKDIILGKTEFYFRLTEKGVIPEGNSESGFELCKDTSAWTNAIRCAGWVISHKNMDYLKCPDKLNWNGPHSCKEAK